MWEASTMKDNSSLSSDGSYFDSYDDISKMSPNEGSSPVMWHTTSYSSNNELFSAEDATRKQSYASQETVIEASHSKTQRQRASTTGENSKEIIPTLPARKGILKNRSMSCQDDFSSLAQTNNHKDFVRITVSSPTGNEERSECSSLESFDYRATTVYRLTRSENTLLIILIK